MNIEVGMYVRTFEGKIFKIQDLKDELIYVSNTECYFYKSLYGGDYCFRFPNENNHYTITKASHNIIDLIEVGDFITLGENNYPVQIRNLWEHGGDIHIELSNGAKIEDLHCNKDFKIYSIVTKEQFESMAYRIGE